MGVPWSCTEQLPVPQVQTGDLLTFLSVPTVQGFIDQSHEAIVKSFCKLLQYSNQVQLINDKRWL